MTCRGSSRSSSSICAPKARFSRRSGRAATCPTKLPHGSTRRSRRSWGRSTSRSPARSWASDGHRPGHQSAGPIDPQHSEDHTRAGARRGGEAEAGPVAHRGHASLRRPHARAHGRDRALELAGEFTGFTDQPRYADAQAIAHRLADLYTEGEVDRVIVVYNKFESALVQRVTVQDILPLSEDLLETGDEERQDDAMRGDFIFEPEPEQILERLLPVYIETELYRDLLESAASEHSARMTAMRSASKNAGELIDTLTLAMNRARQAEITQEILEVVAGADAQMG